MPNKNHIKLLNLLVLLFIPIILASCVSTLPNIQTFYQGNNSQMYFMMPIEFEGEDNNALIDFTYTHVPDSTTNVRCNFTVIFDETPIYKIETAKFVAADKTSFPISEISLLFREMNNRKIRYTGKLPYNDFESIFRADDFSFVFHSQEKEYLLKSTNSVKKRAKEIRMEILDPISHE